MGLRTDRTGTDFSSKTIYIMGEQVAPIIQATTNMAIVIAVLTYGKVVDKTCTI